MKKQLHHALVEYGSHGVFIFSSYCIYTFLPYFQGFLQPEAKQLIFWLGVGYFVLGLPYFLLRNFFFWDKYKDSENKSTKVLKYLAKAGKSIGNILKSIPKERKFLDFHIDESTRVAMLSVVLKFYYIPLMLSFFVGNFQIVERLWNNAPTGLSLPMLFMDWMYFLIYNAIFLLDVTIFSIGYLFEAKWLGNTIKSVDPYVSGWVFALICYPPFNNTIGTILPDSTGSATNFSFSLLFACRITIILLYLVYVWATVALWTKSSNLTNRGIIAHGPYAFIRHPAYISKNLAWWLEKLPYLTSWTGILALLVWNGIYCMRALTEERHLLADPAYQEYAKKVRFRFIPGLI